MHYYHTLGHVERIHFYPQTPPTALVTQVSVLCMHTYFISAYTSFNLLPWDELKIASYGPVTTTEGTYVCTNYKQGLRPCRLI